MMKRKIVTIDEEKCNGIANAVCQALIASGKIIPWNVVTVSTEGDIIED